MQQNLGKSRFTNKYPEDRCDGFAQDVGSTLTLVFAKFKIIPIDCVGNFDEYLIGFVICSQHLDACNQYSFIAFSQHLDTFDQ